MNKKLWLTYDGYEYGFWDEKPWKEHYGTHIHFHTSLGYIEKICKRYFVRLCPGLKLRKGQCVQVEFRQLKNGVLIRKDRK